MLFRFDNAAALLFVYARAANFFLQKMVHLLLLTAPVTSALGEIISRRLIALSVIRRQPQRSAAALLLAAAASAET